jgi:hypothetical protein
MEATCDGAHGLTGSDGTDDSLTVFFGGGLFVMDAPERASIAAPSDLLMVSVR